jgi:hypothetical protein
MIFRIVPTHIKIQAEEACRKTLERGTSDEPMAQRIAKTLKAFADIGITRERVETKIGMKADAMTPVDLANLRVSYGSIKREEISAEEEFPSVTAHALAAELGGGRPATKPVETKAPETKPAETVVAGEDEGTFTDETAPIITKIEVEEIDGQKHWKGWADRAKNAVPLLDKAHVEAWKMAHADEMTGLVAASKKLAGEVEAALAAKAKED